MLPVEGEKDIAELFCTICWEAGGRCEKDWRSWVACTHWAKFHSATYGSLIFPITLLSGEQFPAQDQYFSGMFQPHQHESIQFCNSLPIPKKMFANFPIGSFIRNTIICKQHHLIIISASEDYFKSIFQQYFVLQLQL